MSRRMKYLLLTLISAVSFSVMGVVFYQLLNKEDPVEVEIGSPFELIRHTGETVTNESFRGRYLLMYFGTDLIGISIFDHISGCVVESSAFTGLK